MSLDQYNAGQATDRFYLENSKLLKVTLQGTQVQSKLGAMVAYVGDVRFERSGSGGLGKFMKKQLTGESATFMSSTGNGEVFYADTAKDVHLIPLNGTLTVNGPSILAFEQQINWDIKRVQGGGGMMAGGLFNVELTGQGYVALTTDGPPVRLDLNRAPTFVDAQAAVAWSNCQVGIKTDIGFKTLIGRGSGESFQMAFTPSGPDAWVLVQPSEGPPVVGAA